MFNPAIFLKTVRDLISALVLCGLGLIAFNVVFVWAMLNMGPELLDFVSKIPFIAKIFEIAMGIKVSGQVSINTLFSVSFTHAVVLALTWSVIISATTRSTVGEIEWGTADLLLTLPVNRLEVFVSTTLAWLQAAVVLSLCPIAGIWLGTQIFETKEPVELYRYIAPSINFLCLNLAVGGISSLVGCIANRRGPAVGTLVGVLITSVVLTFLEPFLEWVKQIRFLSLLSYFRPVDIVRTGEWPIQSMIVLLTTGLACWVIGAVIFCRKNIPTA